MRVYQFFYLEKSSENVLKKKILMRSTRLMTRILLFIFEIIKDIANKEFYKMPSSAQKLGPASKNEDEGEDRNYEVEEGPAGPHHCHHSVV